MAVYTHLYGEREPQYVGCTLDSYERNGYQDSDWYAICWDEDQGKVVHVNYDTTRAAGGGYCTIDATEEVIRKVYRHYFDDCRKHFDSITNAAQAKKLRKGDTVRVVRGVKIPKGTIATVFWLGRTYNQFSRCEEDRAGIEINGERTFIRADYLEVIGWENRLLSGKKRKAYIRANAIGMMPWAALGKNVL